MVAILKLILIKLSRYFLTLKPGVSNHDETAQNKTPFYLSYQSITSVENRNLTRNLLSLSNNVFIYLSLSDNYSTKLTQAPYYIVSLCVWALISSKMLNLNRKQPRRLSYDQLKF